MYQDRSSGIYLLIICFYSYSCFLQYILSCLSPDYLSILVPDFAVFVRPVPPFNSAFHPFSSPSLSSLSSPCPFPPTHSLVTLSPSAISHTPTSLIHLIRLSGRHQFTLRSLPSRLFLFIPSFF